MGKRITYKKGDKLGPYNIEFVKEVEPYKRPNGGVERKGQFICPICGAFFETLIYSVKSGKTRSCGCYAREKRKELKQDLIGKRFDRLLVIDKYYDEEKEKWLWKCRCDCGKETYASTRSLNAGEKKSCGCLLSETAKKNGRNHINNLIGQHFGKLTVIKESPYRSGTNIKWECKCECGNITYVDGSSLLNGDTQSCGCFRKEFASKNRRKDLVNQQFGELTVIKDSGKRIDGNIIWVCSCSCGNIKEIPGGLLTSGRALSCGCLQGSLGEQRIHHYLFDKNIKFKREKTFDDCLNPDTNMNLRFDFYLPDYNCCIEYDGEQHFKESGMCDDSLEDRQIRDQIKTQYCKDHDIKLIRIPYTEYNNIETILDKELLQLTETK